MSNITTRIILSPWYGKCCVKRNYYKCLFEGKMIFMLGLWLDTWDMLSVFPSPAQCHGQII